MGVGSVSCTLDRKYASQSIDYGIQGKASLQDVAL